MKILFLCKTDGIHICFEAMLCRFFADRTAHTHTHTHTQNEEGSWFEQWKSSRHWQHGFVTYVIWPLTRRNPLIQGSCKVITRRCYPRAGACLSCLVSPGMGLPKLPCFPGVGARPPAAPRPKLALEPGRQELNPAPLRCGMGKWGTPNSSVKVAARSQNIPCQTSTGKVKYITFLVRVLCCLLWWLFVRGYVRPWKLPWSRSWGKRTL